MLAARGFFVYNKCGVRIMDERLLQLDTALFSGIRREDRGPMLHCTGYHISSYRKGQVIAMEDEQIRHVGIVLSGAVDMVKEDLWGNKTMLLRAGKNDLFGESFACAEDTQSVVSFFALEDCEILFIPFHRIMHTCSHACEFHHQLIENMVRVIAGKNRELMRKIEVVSRKTLREKILTYLSIQAQSRNARYFEVPLGRVELAEYLCADRSALTRELAAMKADGLIDYDKNMFRIF